jgi:fatty-acid desaturase
MITINKQIILANSLNYEIEYITQRRENGFWSAEIGWKVLNEKGEMVERYTQNKNHSEYNTWFAKYTSGIYLIEDLSNELNITTAVSPSLEDEFTN